MNILHTRQELEALTSHGTADERARWAAGALPDGALVALARPVLFAAFAELAEYQPMDASAIPHPRDPATKFWTCAALTGRPLPIAWKTRFSPLLSDTETATLERVHAAIATTSGHPWLRETPGGITAHTRIHTGTCHACHRRAAVVTELIQVTWAGRPLSKEIAL